MPDALQFGTMLLVEFEAHSLWYETAFTLTAAALKNGIVTDYHSFQHPPNDIRLALGKIGVDPKKMQDEGTLVIIDSHTIQTGLGVPEIQLEQFDYLSRTLKVEDWSIAVAKLLKARAIPARLHIDDNISVLSRYNQESAILDFYRTRIFPGARAAGIAFLNAFVTGVIQARSINSSKLCLTV